MWLSTRQQYTGNLFQMVMVTVVTLYSICSAAVHTPEKSTNRMRRHQTLLCVGNAIHPSAAVGMG